MPAIPHTRGFGPSRWAACAALCAALLLVVMAPAPIGRAAPAPAGASAAETALADRWSPVVRLAGLGVCGGSGDPYLPVPVEAVLGSDEVALRGPWDGDDLVAVAPTAAELSRPRFGYHLDFPGNPLSPGCAYADWSRRINAAYPPTTYAHIAGEDGHPGLLSLQYWFFYVFNQWNNTHEGDWEMIQLVFPADTPEQALGTTPVRVGYSQHSSAEGARVGDGKLELVDGTHPVVHPGAGSHANYYSGDLYLMRSSAEGVGCDDSGGPYRELRPAVDVIPSARADYLRSHPWLAYRGHWGQREAAFYNGPTGPTTKTQWDRPITWSESGWRDRSFTVPAGGLIGTQATDFFCSAIGWGSETVRRAGNRPVPTAIVLGALALLAAWLLTRTRWQPATTAIGGRREWGQIISSAWRIYRSRPRLFLGIAVVFVPVSLATTALQYLLFQMMALSPLVDEAGESNGVVAAAALGLGVVGSLLAFTVVQAVTARALVGLERGETVTPLTAYAGLARRAGPLAMALLVAIPVQVALDLTGILIPVAVFLLVRWSLVGVLAGLDEPGGGLLRRSGSLTAGHFWRTATLVLGVTGAALMLGPVAGALGLLATSATFDLINVVAAVVNVVALPVPAIAMTLLAGDLRARRAERGVPDPATDGGAPAAA